jgi:hypothetical protein
MIPQVRDATVRVKCGGPNCQRILSPRVVHRETDSIAGREYISVSDIVLFGKGERFIRIHWNGCYIVCCPACPHECITAGATVTCLLKQEGLVQSWDDGHNLHEEAIECQLAGREGFLFAV